MIGVVCVYTAGNPPNVKRDEPQAPAPVEQNAGPEYTPEEQLINQRIACARRWRR